MFASESHMFLLDRVDSWIDRTPPWGPETALRHLLEAQYCFFIVGAFVPATAWTCESTIALRKLSLCYGKFR